MGRRVSFRGIRAFALIALILVSATIGWLAAAHPTLAAQASTGDALVLALQVLRPASSAVAEPAEASPVVHMTADVSHPVIHPARVLDLAVLPERPAYTLYVPEGPDEPRHAIVALHGMGGNGPSIAAPILAFARERNWIVIAPTIPYGDWRDPLQLAGEELRLLPQLGTLLDYIPDETGIQMHESVMLFGFSRGAQAALRFTMLYPERVDAVAALSAGTYTLPVKTVHTAAGITSLPLPFGVADIEQRAGRGIDEEGFAAVRYFIGVGARDNREADVPRQWDTILGKTRVERATRFASLLAELGCDSNVAVVPEAGHELSAAMMEHVYVFLAESAARLHQPADAHTTARLIALR